MSQIAFAQDDQVVRFATRGQQLPGCQLYSDAGFDLLDWNGDGKPDIFLPNPSMTAASVHLNEGTRTGPRFGFSWWYPLNLTETEPETVVFNQMQCLCDLNHDGLWDMIVFDGQLRMIYNTGTANGPNHWNLALPSPFFPGSGRMIRENARATIAPESMYWGKGVFPRQVLTMAVADWDGDGLEDLLICRFKAEAPKVYAENLPASSAQPPESNWHVKLPRAPERGVYFYKNLGDRESPWFDTGVEIITPDGKSIAAPNPVVADIDGDGIGDLVSTETAYACNTFRVDWPTEPTLIWFRRSNKEDVGRLDPAQPVRDAAKKPIPAGVQARFADFRGIGVGDLMVLDPGSSIRWYLNGAKKGKRPVYTPPTVLTGTDFARFGFMYQVAVVDWFGPQSRDLLIHGCYDPHCQKALRRTALYRNTAAPNGALKYAFAGYLNYRGDPAMVPQTPAYERTDYDIYGSYAALMPDDGSGKKRLAMSVSGKLYLFTNLDAGKLTFGERKPLDITNPDPGKELIRSCPVLIDWNRDGKCDLALAALNAGKAWPFEKEYRLYLNRGDNDAPRFDDYVLFGDENGKPIKLQATGVPASVAPQCGLSVLDLDGDGKLDLVVEDAIPATGLRAYLNISSDPIGQPRFKYARNLGDRVPIEYPCGYRYFYCGDVDGDGVADLVNNINFFKGFPAGAPPQVADLAVAGVDREGVELRWTRPAGAVEYDLRAGEGRELTEFDWPRLTSLRGKYTAADGAVQTARLPLAAGKEVRIAIKSSNARGELSPLSEPVTAIAPPRRFCELRNGPAALPYRPAYGGNQACCVDATTPDKPVAKQPSKLEARTMSRANSSVSPKQKVILIRFSDLPQIAGLERAELQLTTDPKFEKTPLLDAAMAEMSCSSIRDDWDAAKATFAEAAPGKPWAAFELDAGGTFLSKAPIPNTVGPRHVLCWDVTRALKDAQKDGRTSVSLLVRAEYTGKYSCNAGYNFCGPDWPVAEYRPRLCLVSKE